MNPVELDKFVHSHRCAMCGFELSYGPWGEGGTYIARCGADPSHEGFAPMYTATQHQRIGTALPAVIQPHTQERGLAVEGLHRGIALVMNEFPRADLNRAEAALFLLSCLRIGLDPIYGEAVPAPFRDPKRGTRKIQMIITELGYLSMAARGCPHSWQGPPNVTPITDPNQREAICSKRDAWVWAATGRTALMAPGDTTTSYGVFTKEEHQKAIDDKTPAADNPANQARVRAIKHWIMENFAEAKANMMQMTGAHLDKVEGVPDVLDLIDTEYRIEPAPNATRPHWCEKHNTAFFKSGKMRHWGHKIEGTDDWCHEDSVNRAKPTDHTPPPPPEGEMGFGTFYDIAFTKLGYTSRQQIHGALGVTSMDQYNEPLETALDTLAQLAGQEWK